MFKKVRNYVNELKIRFKNIWKQPILKKDIPKNIRIDASTICQLNCPCCYMRTENPPCGIGYLKFKDFKKIVDENDLESIELSNSGEIFSNPELLKILKYAFKKKIRLSARNGVNLNTVSDEILESLVKYRFGDMKVAIDGASQEIYSIYRRNGNFERVIANIKRINYYKEKYNSIYPNVIWQFIIFGHNEHEIPKAKKMAKDLNIGIVFALNWDKEYSQIKDRAFVEKETGLKNININEDHEDNIKNQSWIFCFQLWDQPQINWDGELLGCCRLSDDNFGANVFKMGLENALYSEKYLYAKKMLKGELPPKEGIPCTSCNLYKIMQENNKYIIER